MLASTKLFIAAYAATAAALDKVKACGHAKGESLLSEACVRLLSGELAKFAPAPGPELNESEKELVRSGNKIAAIKEYRIRNLSADCTLMIAKDAVEKWMAYNGY